MPSVYVCAPIGTVCWGMKDEMERRFGGSVRDTRTANALEFFAHDGVRSIDERACRAAWNSMLRAFRREGVVQ